VSEWFDSQKKPRGNFRQLLQERIEKSNPRRKLTAEESKRLAKLEAIAYKLKRGENVQNRQLQTWLTEDEYAQLEEEWQEQLELREELKVEVAKRVKRWWTASVDGKINIVVRYGSKPLEFAKGKNAIELANEAEVADVLSKVREAAELGELDALIEQQAQFGRRMIQKSK
jgi:hypothetical protein